MLERTRVQVADVAKPNLRLERKRVKVFLSHNSPSKTVQTQSKASEELSSAMR